MATTDQVPLTKKSTPSLQLGSAVAQKVFRDWNSFKKSNGSSISSEDEITKRKIYSEVYHRMDNSDSESTGDETANFEEIFDARLRRPMSSVESTLSDASMSNSPISTLKHTTSTAKVQHALAKQGQLKLVACGSAKKLTVTLLEVRNIASSMMKTIYIKVCLLSESDEEDTARIISLPISSKGTILHETISFNVTKHCLNKRLLIEVWINQMSPVNFQGCTSFGIKRFMQEGEVVQGSYYLLSARTGRRKHLAVKPLMNNEEKQYAIDSKNTLSETPSTAKRKRLISKKQFQIPTHLLMKQILLGCPEESPPQIRTLEEGSELHTIGLRKRDILISLNGKNISHLTNFGFQNTLRECGPTILLRVHRSTKQPQSSDTHLSPRNPGKRKQYKKHSRNSKKRKMEQKHTPRRIPRGSKKECRVERCTKISGENRKSFGISGKNLHSYYAMDDDEVFLPDFTNETPGRVRSTVAENQLECEAENQQLIAPRTPMCLASLTYKNNLKSAKIVRRKSYCEPKVLFASTTSPEKNTAPTFQRSSSLRKSAGFYKSARCRNILPLNKQTPENSCRFLYYSELPVYNDTTTRRELYFNEVGLLQEEDNVEVVSVTSSCSSSHDSELKLSTSEDTSSENEVKNWNEKQDEERNIRKLSKTEERDKNKRFFFIKSKKTKKVDEDSKSKPVANLLSILEDKTKCAAFRNFLSREHSEENLDFWCECESYKSKKTSKQRKMAQLIYRKFIESGADNEVNINAKIRSKVEENLQNPSSELFHEAQSSIYNLMESDSYRRYLSSLRENK